VGVVVVGVGVADAAPGDGIVSIGDLLYRGDAASQRLTSLRDQVRRVLAGASPDGAALKDLIEEVFDLVELGAGRGR
jgi:ATP-dependent protease HslVU (ClpYQ) peptidase subunit